MAACAAVIIASLLICFRTRSAHGCELRFVESCPKDVVNLGRSGNILFTRYI